ncbi:hypothetical protein Tco_0117065 [Tanacetum coccineum]
MGTKPEKQDTSSSSGNYTTQAVDADIGPVNDDEPFAETTELRFTSERPEVQDQRFDSQVDEKNDCQKYHPHYLPKVRESAAAKPHQVNAPNYSRNSHKESYGSNDMVHAYFLEDARKMTQDKTRIPNHKDMASTRAHCTPNACTPKPRNIYRSSPVSKCSGGMSNGEPLVDHSRNSSFFLDSKQFVCSICHKYIFNTNHDDCIIKILNKVNSRAKVQSPKIRNNLSRLTKEPTQETWYICQSFKGKTRSLVTKKTDISYVRNSNLMNMLQMMFEHSSSSLVLHQMSFGQNSSSLVLHQKMFGQYSSGLVLHLDDVWTNQFKPRSSSNDVWTKQFKPRSSSNDVWSKRFKPRSFNVNWRLLATLQARVLKYRKVLLLQEKGKIRWQKRIFPAPNYKDEMKQRSFIAQNSYRLERKPSLSSTEVKSISLTKAEEEAVAREVHATHARIVEKSKVIEESDSTIPDPNQQTVTSTPPVIAPFTDVSSTKPLSLVTSPPINTEATTITTSLPEITPFIALQLRVARLEQEIFNREILSAGLARVYQNQESKKISKVRLSESKRTRWRNKQDSHTQSKSTDKVDLEEFDKVALEEFDLKSALFKHMNKNKTANRNPANYHLYHALMEALIADEDAMDKEVAVKVKDHKKKTMMKMKALQLDHTRVGQQREEDPNLPLLGQFSLLRKMITKVQRNHGSLMHLLPNNIQITNTNSFIVSKKRSSDSSKKLKGIQTLTPAEQEAADIMKALKESKKMSKRQPGTGGLNEGTGNILGVPDEEKLILEWEADVDSEHFNRDDNVGDDNEETKHDPEEIYK